MPVDVHTVLLGIEFHRATKQLKIIGSIRRGRVNIGDLCRVPFIASNKPAHPGEDRQLGVITVNRVGIR